MGPYGKSSPLQTPLKKVRGLGSSRDGTQHYWLQRLSAAALVPLLFWFMFGLTSHLASDQESFRQWVGGLGTSFVLILTIIAMFWHASMGLQIVIEDYVHHHLTRMASVMFVKISCASCAVLGVLSVLKIMMQVRG